MERKTFTKIFDETSQIRMLFISYYINTQCIIINGSFLRMAMFSNAVPLNILNSVGKIVFFEAYQIYLFITLASYLYRKYESYE